MIYCVIGTRAQLIKMAPLVKLLEQKGLATTVLMTGQHQETMDEIYQDFGLTTPYELLYSGSEITRIGQTFVWLVGQLGQLIRLRSKIRSRQDTRVKDIVLVHGDTLSTLLGAIGGKLWKVPVAHVEAGLRSFKLFEPFPEEIVRRVVTRLANVAYCPGAWAFDNLAYANGVEKINVGHNTLIDSLRLALANQKQHSQVEDKYVVVSTHRFENIFNDSRLRSIVAIVTAVAERARVVFVLHPATRKQLCRKGHMPRLESNPNIELVPRMSYSDFVGLLTRASCLLTDGGGNQEEMAYLGKPAFLLRAVTERMEGLGKNVVLTGFDRELILSGIETSLNSASSQPTLACDAAPSLMIAEHLVAYGRR